MQSLCGNFKTCKKITNNLLITLGNFTHQTIKLKLNYQLPHTENRKKHDLPLGFDVPEEGGRKMPFTKNCYCQKCAIELPPYFEPAL
jgi:hypothetical protein